MFSVEIVSEVRECVLCWLATVDADGSPNVSPKEIFSTFGGNRILIANIASPGSVKNISQNSAVCVSCVNVFKQKGYKFKGRAKNLYPTEQGYKEKFDILYKLAGPSFPIKSIIEVEVQQLFPILAPSYILYPETTEPTQIENALKTYGVVFSQ
ncbi:MAG: pyridoxamine 5'-phosphate oxidase family protein [Pseudomonadota bacterium]